MHSFNIFKVSVLMLFDKLLSSSLFEEDSELVRFVRHVLEKFFKKVSSYPLLLVEVAQPEIIFAHGLIYRSHPLKMLCGVLHFLYFD